MLSTTTKGYPVGFGGLAAGLTLGMIHLATIPVDNTSVNPARSFGHGGVRRRPTPSRQLWVFIIFPLVGAVLGVLVWLLVHEERLEDTMFGGQAGLVAARDKAAGVAGQVAGPLPVAGRRPAVRRGSGRSCLSRLAAFCALFHSRTAASDSGPLMSATERGTSSPNLPAASRQPSGATPCVLARMATKIRDFSSP